MQKFYEEGVVYHGMQKFQNPEESNLFLSLGQQHVDVYFPSRKRSRVSAPFVFTEQQQIFKKRRQTSIDILPDECLFEILRRISCDQEKSACASVSKRWLMLLSTIRKEEVCVSQTSQNKEEVATVEVKPPVLFDINKKDEVSSFEKDTEDFEVSGGCLSRCLKGKKATNVRLAAIGVNSSGRGGLRDLAVLGNNASKVTDFGLKAIARGCSSLTSLTLYNLSAIKDEGIIEIAKECHFLEKIEFCHCPTISNESLLAIAKNCPNLATLVLESCSQIGNEGLQAIGQSCQNLKTISIKNCSLIGDKGITSLISSRTSSLTKIRLESIPIGDMSLAVIGHYGLTVVDLSLTGLCNVTEKGFWVMGNGQGLQNLKSLTIIKCNSVTDLGLEALGRGCPNLKQVFVLNSGFLSDNGVVSFAKASKSLESFQLEECHKVTQLGIFGLVVNSTKLKNLSLKKCIGIQDSPMIIPSSLPHSSLKSLSISNCPSFGNFSLSLFGRICQQIQEITLTETPKISDSGLLSLMENFNFGLTKVNLSGCLNITDKVVSEISLQHGASLESLNLDGCSLITDASVVSIAQNCCSLKELAVSNSMITDYAVAALACAEHLSLHLLSLSKCGKLSNKSIPFLRKLGDSLMGLNMMQCGGISKSEIASLEEEIWNCDILV